jgi:hypothetical protein
MTEPYPLPKLFTEEETKDALRISIHTLRRERRRRRIAFVRVGDRVPHR